MMREVPHHLKPAVKKTVKEMYWEQSIFRKGKFFYFYMTVALGSLMNRWFQNDLGGLSVTEIVIETLIMGSLIILLTELIRFLEIRNREELRVIRKLIQEQKKTDERKSH